MKKIITITLTVVLLGFILINVGHAVDVPGSDGDPIITLSYFNLKIQEMVTSLQTTIASVQTKLREYEITSTQSKADLLQISKKVDALTVKVETFKTSEGYKLVELPIGKSIICEESTEIILRAGKAVVIGSKGSGLSDVTDGQDVQVNNSIIKNHLLIVPRTDGRGVLAKANCAMMIKGSYSIHN